MSNHSQKTRERSRSREETMKGKKYINIDGNRVFHGWIICVCVFFFFLFSFHLWLVLLPIAEWATEQTKIAQNSFFRSLPKFARLIYRSIRILLHILCVHVSYSTFPFGRVFSSVHVFGIIYGYNKDNNFDISWMWNKIIIDGIHEYTDVNSSSLPATK